MDNGALPLLYIMIVHYLVTNHNTVIGIVVQYASRVVELDADEAACILTLMVIEWMCPTITDTEPATPRSHVHWFKIRFGSM